MTQELWGRRNELALINYNRYGCLDKQLEANFKLGTEVRKVTCNPLILKLIYEGAATIFLTYRPKTTKSKKFYLCFSSVMEEIFFFWLKKLH